MEAVYVTHYPIPELGAEPGDHLVVEPSAPDFPLQVVRNFDRHTLVRLMGSGHLERLSLVAGELVPRPSPSVRPALPSRPRLAVIRGGA